MYTIQKDKKKKYNKSILDLNQKFDLKKHIDNEDSYDTEKIHLHIKEENVDFQSHFDTQLKYHTSLIDLGSTIEEKSIHSNIWSNIRLRLSEDFEDIPFQTEKINSESDINQNLNEILGIKDTTFNKISINEPIDKFEKGKKAFLKELSTFLALKMEGKYVAYIEGIYVGMGDDDEELFLEVLKKYEQTPDFIGYINEEGIKKISYLEII